MRRASAPCVCRGFGSWRAAERAVAAFRLGSTESRAFVELVPALASSLEKIAPTPCLQRQGKGGKQMCPSGFPAARGLLGLQRAIRAVSAGGVSPRGDLAFCLLQGHFFFGLV